MYSSSDTDNNIDIYSIAKTEKDTITDHNEAEETAGNEMKQENVLVSISSKAKESVNMAWSKTILSYLLQ